MDHAGILKSQVVNAWVWSTYWGVQEYVCNNCCDFCRFNQCKCKLTDSISNCSWDTLMWVTPTSMAKSIVIQLAHIKTAHLDQDLWQETHTSFLAISPICLSLLFTPVVSKSGRFHNNRKDNLLASMIIHPQELSNTEQFTSARMRISDPLKNLRLLDGNRGKQQWKLHHLHLI